MSVGLTEQKRNRSEQNMQSRRWRLTQRRFCVSDYGWSLEQAADDSRNIVAFVT